MEVQEKLLVRSTSDELKLVDYNRNVTQPGVVDDCYKSDSKQDLSQSPASPLQDKVPVKDTVKLELKKQESKTVKRVDFDKWIKY